MANERVRRLSRGCLVPPHRAAGVGSPPAPDVRLVAAGAALMVLLAVASLVAVTVGAPAAAFLPLAGLALAVRPALVLHQRRRTRRAHLPVRARRVPSLH